MWNKKQKKATLKPTKLNEKTAARYVQTRELKQMSDGMMRG